MNYFWGNLFDYFKERREASLFYGVFGFFMALFAIGIILCQTVDPDKLQAGMEYGVPALGTCSVVWMVRKIARARKYRPERYKSSPLSRDECIKARSKLISRKK